MLLSTPTRSLRHEYATYVDLEIERYKDSIARSALLTLADDAVAELGLGTQLVLNELVLVDAVNALIMRRLKLPSYDRWRRNRLKILDQLRRAEHWSASAAQHLAAAVRPEDHPHIVVAGPHVEERALYLAANGAHVTALGDLHDEDLVTSVLMAAAQAGISGQVEACADGLDEWAPEVPVRAVVWHMAVLNALSPERRARVMAHLQNATAAGGVHYIEGFRGDSAAGAMSMPSLVAAYPGWQRPESERDGIIVLHKPRVA
jgi:hypothetical protein